MSLNPEVYRQAQEIIFSWQKNINDPVFFFDNLPKKQKIFSKTPWSIAGWKVKFFRRINEKLKKVTNSINLLWKLNLTLPRSSLLIIYKSFIRPHLDYRDIVYDQPNNSSLSQKIESL